MTLSRAEARLPVLLALFFKVVNAMAGMVQARADVSVYVIYLRDDRILLSRRRYDSWQQIQEGVVGYMASLGPWSPEATIEYLDDEYPGLDPTAATQVHALLASAEPIVCLRFKQE